MAVVPQKLIDRQQNYRAFSQVVDVPRGQYWTLEAKKIDSQLTEEGYQATAAGYWYLPREIKEYDTLNGRHFVANYKYKHIVYHYNLIQRFVQPKAVCEIGGGCGHLAGLFAINNDSCVAVIDLPEMIRVAASFLFYLFPKEDKKVLLPNERNGKATTADIEFFLPTQIEELKDRKFDLCINIDSFMEMSTEEVDKYFRFINEHTNIGGHFFCCNREEKDTKFVDYPWDKYGQWEDVYFEKCKHSIHVPFLERMRKKHA